MNKRTPRNKLIEMLNLESNCLFCTHFKTCNIVYMCKLQEQYKKIHTDFTKLICNRFKLRRYIVYRK